MGGSEPSLLNGITSIKCMSTYVWMVIFYRPSCVLNIGQTSLIKKNIGQTSKLYVMHYCKKIY